MIDETDIAFINMTLELQPIYGEFEILFLTTDPN